MVRRRDSISVSNGRVGYGIVELRQRLEPNIDKLVRQLYGEDAALSDRGWHVRTVTGGKGTGCLIERSGIKAGHWYDQNPHARCREGDAIELISIAKNLNTDGAVQWAAAWLKLTAESLAESAETSASAGEASILPGDAIVYPLTNDDDTKSFEDDLRQSSHGREAVMTDDCLRSTLLELAIQRAGPENLGRLKSNLRRHQAALDHLFALGLTSKTISKFHLGIKEPYTRRDGRVVSNALCYPVISSTGDPLSRYACYNIPGITQNPVDEIGWSKGRPITYYSGSTEGKDVLFIIASCKELWAVDQHLASTVVGGKLVIICPSHGDSVPEEWEHSAFWSTWATVYLGLRNNGESDSMTYQLARTYGRGMRRVYIPGDSGTSWLDFFLRGGTAEQLAGLLQSAPKLTAPELYSAGPNVQTGEFAATPVNINGAYANGFLYYPFTVERREVERVEHKKTSKGEAMGQVVTSYVTKVLRSDGAVLDIVRLAAPRGTPSEKRVLALTDGTRIEREPQPNHYATWQLASLQSFIRAMQSEQPPPHRPLKDVLDEVLAHFRRSVWLPYEEDYFVLSLYVAMSFVYQVFEAIPLVIVSGEKGTGKSELGDSIAKIAFNATIVGQGSAAGLIRLLNEARGLVVLDDLESVGRSLGDASFSDINQMLKLSYKKRTGRKAITDKSGKTTIFDFYGPKVINNTQGVDPVLGSRMVHVRTQRMPDAIRLTAKITGSDPGEMADLRNELHVWGMANARAVHERYLGLMGHKGDRSEEISAPLRAVADLSGDNTFRSSLESALMRQTARRVNADNPVALLEEAVNNCIRQGALRELSAVQISLEIHLIANQSLPQSPMTKAPVWLQPEWIGHQLRALEIRNIEKKVGRVRLYGIVTRIYELHARYVESVLEDLRVAGIPSPASKDPLAFCEQMTCEKCPYSSICDTTISSLRRAKMLNRGRSGRKVDRLSHAKVE
jgi:hypothetical protein